MDENNLEASNTFSVSPMGQILSLTAGEETTGSITVINPLGSSEPFSYKVTIAPYGVTNDSYDADLITETTLTQLAKWITIENPTGTIEPGKSEEIKFTINTPSTAPGGGQYAALVVSSDDQDKENDSSMVKYIYEMASILYGEVDGETIHEGSIIDHTVPGFSTTPNVFINTTIENKGNIHEYARVKLSITNFFSGEDIFNSEEGEIPIGELIMPYSTRFINRELANLPSIGIVDVKESIDYLGQNSTIEQRLIICPVWFMLILAAVLVGAIAGIVVAIKRKKKNR